MKTAPDRTQAPTATAQVGRNESDRGSIDDTAAPVGLPTDLAPPVTKKKAYSYIRMSTRGQEHGDSLRRQKDRMYEFISKRDLELVENYRDIGVSAYRRLNYTHGELRAFIDAVDRGDVEKGSYLIIESMDRLSRATATTAFSMMIELIDKGITLVTLDSGLEYSQETSRTNHTNLFIAIGEMIRAHEESRRKSEMISHAWEEKRKQLRTAGRPMTSRVPAWLRLSSDGKHIEVIPERAEVVNAIFNYACNGYGTYSIARMLNESGVAPWGTVKTTKVHSGKKPKLAPVWHESYIKKIISNRAVLGEFQPHRQEITTANVKLRIPDGEPIEGYYPAMVPEELFRSANLALARRQTGSKGRKGPTYANLFTGLLFCNRCGSGMRYIDKGPPPKGGQYLRCSRTVTSRSCVSKIYRYHVVEQSILSFLETLDVERVLGGAPLAKRIAEKKHAADILEMEITGLDQQIAFTVEAITKGVSPQLVTRLSDMERKRTKAQIELSIVRSEIADAELLNPAARKAALNKLLEAIGKDMPTEERLKTRRALAAELQRILDRMTLNPSPAFAFEEDEVHVSWRKSYERSSYTRLQKYLDDYGFELSIRYRNGIQQIFKGFDETALRLKWEKRFRDLKLVSEFE